MSSIYTFLKPHSLCYFLVQCTWLLEVLDPQLPVLFIDTDLLPASEVRSGRNVYNESEAALVATITHGLIKSGVDCDDIGVISPYRQQLKVIKQHLNVDCDDDK
jgi:DNA replication ATP-dependent helicase Dna2